MTASVLLGGPYDGEDLDVRVKSDGVLLPGWLRADGLVHQDEPGIFVTVRYRRTENTSPPAYDYAGFDLSTLSVGWRGEEPDPTLHNLLAPGCRAERAAAGPGREVRVRGHRCYVCEGKFIVNAMTRPETPENVALLTGDEPAPVPEDRQVTVPDHVHVWGDRGRGLQRACHPGCPAYVLPEPRRGVMRGGENRRGQLVAATELAAALDAQRVINDIDEQIDLLRQEARPYVERRDGCLDAVKELRYSLNECRDVLVVLAADGPDDGIDTASGYVHHLRALLAGTALPVELNEWPRQRDVERMAEQNAATDAKESTP